MKIISYTCLASSLLFASIANAQFTVYDGFLTPGDYTANTDIVGQNANAGTGDWNGAWIRTGPEGGGPFETITASLGYTDSKGNVLATSSGSLSKSGSNAVIERGYSSAYGTTFSNASTDLWFSLIFNVSDSTDIIFRAATISAGNGPGFDVSDTGALTARFNNSTSPAFALTEGINFIVARVQQDAGAGGEDVLDIWVNPDLDVAPMTVAAASAERSFALANADAASARSRNGDTFDLDEFRVGTTFDSVTPIAVPEPSTYALFAGGLALVLLVIRRRR